MRILFVCTGNICRSPTAEGVARHMAAKAGFDVEFDSAGIADYHVGEAPDRRTRQAALKRGYDLASLRARQLDLRDFEHFDLVLAMDGGHMQFMLRICPESLRSRLAMFMSFAADGGGVLDVPDPYYGDGDGFEVVLDCCEKGVEGLLAGPVASHAATTGRR